MQYSWDESMSTGISRLDAQHRTLIEKFNEFTNIIDSHGDIREAAEEALDFLQFYAAWHFRHEEECMEKYDCPVAANNKKAHKEFLAQFGELYQRWQNGTMSQESAKETHARLAAWIMNHIVQIDTRLKPCVPKK
jgi:hemerythrin